MAKKVKKKVYAVRKGNKTGLFDTWEECKAAVHGYSGAVFKSFATKQEAEAYLDQADNVSVAGPVSDHPPQGCLFAYVDGSFHKEIGRYSYGCILLTPEGEVVKESGSGNDPAALELRNVTGEMLGAKCAVKWAIAHGYAAVDIRYDYAGIEQWATHGWQAKNELTKEYAAFMERCRTQITITFTKIAAHTGNVYNEAADRLAKEALEQGARS